MSFPALRLSCSFYVSFYFSSRRQHTRSPRDWSSDVCSSDLKIGDQLYVTLSKDQEERLLALPATEGIFMGMREIAPLDLLNASISGRVYYTSREGSAIFSEDGYRGFVHHTERESEPRLGETVSGRVIEVKDDGTVNVSLLPLKEERIDADG